MFDRLFLIEKHWGVLNFKIIHLPCRSEKDNGKGKNFGGERTEMRLFKDSENSRKFKFIKITNYMKNFYVKCNLFSFDIMTASLSFNLLSASF